MVVISFIVILRIDKSIWLDEAYSIHVASSNFTEIIPHLKNDNGPPLYYFLLAIWIRIFGISEIAVRSLSLVFYILSVLLVYITGKTFFDERAGILCSFLFMLSRHSINQALNTRMYSLLALVGILSTLLFLRLFLQNVDSRREFVFYVIVNILGTLTHYWFMFIILSQAVCYILFLFKRSSFKKYLLTTILSVMPFILLWTPILLFQMNNGSTYWLSKPNILTAVKNTLLYFYGGQTALLVYAAFLGLIVLNFKYIRVKFIKFSELKEYISEKRNIIFVIILLILLLVPLIISQVRPMYKTGRYDIILLFPLVVLIGSLLSRFGNKLLVLLCCYFMLIGISTRAVISDLRPINYSDRLTSEYLVEHTDNNDILIFTSLSRASIDYYLRLLKPGRSFTKISFPAEISTHLGWIDYKTLSNQKHNLENEADDILAFLLEESPLDQYRIWLFYGFNTEIDGILKDRLDKYFYLYAELDLQGSFYNKVFIYQKH